MNDEQIQLLSYVKLSKYRTKVLLKLNEENKLKFASEIAKSVGIRVNHVGTTLKELTEKQLVYCPNPKVNRGKLYEITDKGKKIAEYLSSK